MLEAEKRQKDELATLISHMEKKFVHGGHGMDDIDDARKEQIQKERKLQKLLKKQKKKEEQLLEEKRKEEEERLFAEGKYTSLQQEVDSMREIMDKLRSKYKAAEAEIADLNKEHQQQKGEYLDIIRSQEKAVKFSQKVMSVLLSENEQYKVHQRSKWDDERGEWNVPQFQFNLKSKDVSFPTINAKERVEQAKDERELALVSDTDDVTARKPKNSTNSKANRFESKMLSVERGLSSLGSAADDSVPRAHERSWLENEAFSNDSHSQVEGRRGAPDHGGSTGSKPLDVLSNEIIPERRRKYLSNHTDASLDAMAFSKPEE